MASIGRILGQLNREPASKYDSPGIWRFSLDGEPLLLSKVSESSHLACGGDWQASSNLRAERFLPMLQDRKILVTGGTGQIAGPIAEDFARHNEVWIAARFSNPDRRAQLEALGIKTCVWDMDTGDNSMLPDDFTHVDQRQLAEPK
jgi:hypothetical protein